MNTNPKLAAAEQAMEKLDLSEERYRKAQEHLTSTQQQFERNRKALALAKQEAEDLNREWKKMLREAGGKTNQDVLEKLEASRNARDVAQELEPILETAPEILEAAEVEALTARKTYLKDLEEARGAMLTHEMSEATDAVQELPEFQRFIYTLSQYVKHHQAYQRKEARWRIMGDEFAKSGASTSDDLKAIETTAKGRTCAHLLDVMKFAGLQEDIEGQPGLEELPETQPEKDSPLKHSTIQLMQARKRLGNVAAAQG